MESYVVDIQLHPNKSIKDSYIRHICELNYQNIIGIATIVEAYFKDGKDHIMFYLIDSEINEDITQDDINDGNIVKVEGGYIYPNDNCYTLENITGDRSITRYEDIIGMDINTDLVDDDKWFDMLNDINLANKHGTFFDESTFSAYSLFIVDNTGSLYNYYEIYTIEVLKGLILGSI